MLSDLLFRIRALFRQTAADAELDEELRFHIEQQIEKYLKSGLTREEAMRRVRLDFGGLDQVKEECRDARGVTLVETLLRDLRFGLRTLRNSPGFSAIAVLTLAVGIGANTTIFSVAWRPMRYSDASRLLMVWETRPDGSRSAVSAPTYLDWRDQNTSFEQLAAGRPANVSLSGSPATQVSGARITRSFFDTFRLQPELGRFFSAEEFLTAGDGVAVLSHEIWQSHFGAAPDIVGKTIRLDGERRVVLGVAPAGFEFLGRVDVWMPLALRSGEPDRRARDLLVVGRLKPHVSPQKAADEMRLLAARVATASPTTNTGWGALAQNIHEALAGPGLRLMLLLLVASMSLVLLMACSNVANLLLARATVREKEIAVRVALGATRWRVVRQLLTETLLLALMGGAGGLLLAWGAVRYLATLPVLQAPGLAPIEINQTVLGFAAAISLAATLLSGLVPAWQTSAANLMERVKASGGAALGAQRSRLRDGLVIGGLALSLVLMVTADLSLRSFIRLAHVDPGFRSRGLLTAHLSLPAQQSSDAGRVRAFYSEVLERVRAIPGVENAAIASGLPPSSPEGGRPFRVQGRDPALPQASGFAHHRVISTGYFRTLDLAILKGRSFTEDDRQGAIPTVIVNHRLAEKFFPASDPLGQHLLLSEEAPHGDGPSSATALEVVGVVSDVRSFRAHEPSAPEIYTPYSQAPASGQYLVLRSAKDARLPVEAVQQAIGAVNPDVPLTDISTMDERLDRSLAGRRVVVSLVVIFALLALVMGSAGLYGAISYLVTQRTGEFALRMALGASRREILRLVTSRALRLLLIGGTLGLALSLGATRFLRGMISGVSPYDPIAFLTVTVVLLAVVLLASYLPARRATNIDPTTALRCD
jgi:predicted permease